MVIVAGLVPLILLLLGNRRNRNGPRDALSHQTADQTGRTSKGKKGKYVYSGWRVVVCLDFEQDISSASEHKSDSDDSQLAAALQRLAQEADLYIVAQVDSDDKEKMVMDAVKHRWQLLNHGVAECKVLFCETKVGRVAIARQIEPAIYIDRDEQTVLELKRFIRRVGLITSSKAPADLLRGSHGVATVAHDLNSLMGKL